MIVMRILRTRKVMRIKIMLMVKLREKVFTTIPCPVFLPGCKVGDFYLGFGKAFKKGWLSEFELTPDLTTDGQ